MVVEGLIKKNLPKMSVWWDGCYIYYHNRSKNYVYSSWHINVIFYKDMTYMIISSFFLLLDIFTGKCLCSLFHVTGLLTTFRLRHSPHIWHEINQILTIFHTYYTFWGVTKICHISQNWLPQKLERVSI